MKLSCAGWRRWTNDHTGGCAQLRSYGNKFRTFHPRYRKFESIPLRHAVSDLMRSPGMTVKSARVGAMRPPDRHRRERTCRVLPRHIDFLSVGEEFGADALDEHIA